MLSQSSESVGYRLGPNTTMQDVLDVQDALLDSEVLPGLFAPTNGTQVLSTAFYAAQKRIRVAACKAELVAEAPAARASQEIRKAGSKNESIEPRAAGNIQGGNQTLSELVTDIVIHAAEKAEQLVKDHMKTTRPNLEQFDVWAEVVWEKHQRGESKRALMREYHCGLPLIDKALGVHQGRVDREAA